MVTPMHYLQIFRCVIVLVTVYVVNMFIRAKWTAYFRFSYYAVLVSSEKLFVGIWPGLGAS